MYNDSLHKFQPELDRLNLVNRRTPEKLTSPDDSIPYHVARLVLLLRLAGRPQGEPRIDGRTKLAKLDFFVRYPQFLQKAIDILGVEETYDSVTLADEIGVTVESHMIRYRYGPWDRRYYVLLAYMNGKNLMAISSRDNVDQYTLSSAGHRLASSLLELPEYKPIVARCKAVGELFGAKSGTWLKDFVYRHYPEVVRTPMTWLITPEQEANSHE
jgi:hypothetical protein